MNKKIIIGLFAGLTILILLTIFLPFLMRKNTSTSILPSPAITGQPEGQTISKIDPGVKNKLNQTLPYETSDFKIEYSQTQDKVIATKKTDVADQKIDQWLKENQLIQLKNRPNIFIIQNSKSDNLGNDLAGNPEASLYLTPGINLQPNLSITPPDDNNSKLLVDLLTILLNFGTLTTSTNPTINNPQTISTSPTIALSPSLLLSPTKPAKKTTKTPSGNLVYYAQCNGNFDNYALPSGCTLCQAGCGPTTVAMIVASYADKSVTPKTIVDLYKKKGYLLGCAGSRYTDAKNVLMSYGIKTTDYLVYNYATINQAAGDFKKYINSGWTIFALANYCDGNCGHFFWITEVTANNDTWAYDPYYGRLQKPPYNEKSRYPFPKYKIAFGVKR